ncbi:MAG TPA: HAD family hydrolase, partial [Candidatus Hodarchaeales archaeon]|nr:HAD family hydrolase [Candidatus Hodarchaeales archaeon]
MSESNASEQEQTKSNEESRNRRPCLIIDVDNTLLDQSPRKAAIIQDVIGRREIGIDSVYRDFSLNAVMGDLEPDERGLFWEEFLSPKHYEGSHGPNIKCFTGCSRTMNKLAEKFAIIYVTARPDVAGQKEELIRELKSFGLPLPKNRECELHLMPRTAGLDSHEIFCRYAKEFKQRKIAEISSQYEVIAGLGDTEDDIAAYKSIDILAIQFQDGHYVETRISKADLYFRNWDDIAVALQLYCGTSSPLSNLLELHIKEYGGWLSDLDSKSRLLLIIDTALFAVCFNWLDKVGTPTLRYLLAGCGLLSALAMVFNIRAFASRRVRGERAGDIISMGWYRNVFCCLLGRKPVPPGSPIAYAEEM